jgi:hypothetical protein
MVGYHGKASEAFSKNQHPNSSILGAAKGGESRLSVWLRLGGDGTYPQSCAIESRVSNKGGVAGWQQSVSGDYSVYSCIRYFDDVMGTWVYGMTDGLDCYSKQDAYCCSSSMCNTMLPLARVWNANQSIPGFLFGNVSAGAKGSAALGISATIGPGSNITAYVMNQYTYVW